MRSFWRGIEDRLLAVAARKRFLSRAPKQAVRRRGLPLSCARRGVSRRAVDGRSFSGPAPQSSGRISSRRGRRTYGDVLVGRIGYGAQTEFGVFDLRTFGKWGLARHSISLSSIVTH